MVLVLVGHQLEINLIGNEWLMPLAKWTTLMYILGWPFISHNLGLKKKGNIIQKKIYLLIIRHQKIMYKSGRKKGPKVFIRCTSLVKENGYFSLLKICSKRRTTKAKAKSKGVSSWVAPLMVTKCSLQILTKCQQEQVKYIQEKPTN